jgi:hypothetical protein
MSGYVALPAGAWQRLMTREPTASASRGDLRYGAAPVAPVALSISLDWIR